MNQKSRKTGSRVLACLLAVLMLLSTMSGAVSALSIGSTVNVSGANEWISGFYYDWNGNFGMGGKYGQHQHLHTSDGRPAYCVEPDEHFSSGNKTIRETFDELPITAQRNITAAFLYGYNGNTKYGYSWQTEYVATQAIVWAIAVGAFNTSQETLIQDCAFGGSTSATNKANAKAVYAKIKAQILTHYTIPSFTTGDTDAVSAKKLTLKYNFSTGKYEGSVTDTKGVLSGYTFSSPGVTFTRSGNTLKISTSKTLDGVTVTGERTSNTYVSSLPAICAGYAVGSDQTTAVALDLKDPVNAYFSLETESVGNIKIVKTSEDGKIANVSLHISGNGIEKDVKTGKDGSITVPNLIAGTYTVTEKVDGYYNPQSAQTVTVLPGQTTTVTFNNTLKRGSLVVTKTAEDGILEGHRFHLFGTSDSGLTVETYAVTDSTGKATFSDILIGSGYTLEEVDTGIQYVIPDSQTTSVAWNTVTNASFENILKKFTVTVQKQDSVTGTAQGDATLEGAVYGLYDGDTLVDTYVTDKNGSFTTKEYICGDTWTLRELTPSEGYLLDETVYPVGAEPGNFTIEHNPISMTVTEDVILGQIAIIKHNDDGSTQIETPEVGAEFEIYLKSAGSYGAADDRERDFLTTDENGFAETKKLPYGVYTVHQTKGNEGAEFISDFDVVINQHGEVYRYLINNATFESYIKFTKKDAETGKTIPLAGAGIQLYDPNGELITMSFTYPTPITIDTFYTAADGTLVTPERLPYGKGYKAVEVSAPYGYVLDSTPVYFDVTPETMQEDGGIAVVMVEKSDIAQKGTIDLTKLGEVFSSVSFDGTFYQPVYALANNAGAKFKITAAEDIITPDGTVRAAAGTVVDTVTIGNSTTKSKPLYLGKYNVQEVEAAYGMVLDPTVYEVTLTYAGQNVSVTSAALTITNQRQKVVIDLLKALEQDDLFQLGMNGEISNVQFALYAAEELTAADGSVIPKDGLLEILNVNADGSATFATDLPVDAAVYVQEYATDGHYILSDTKYPVTFEYEGQDTAEVHLSVNNGEAIENKLIRGDIYGKKVDDDGFEVGGALIGLFRPDVTDFTEENAIKTCVSNEIGVWGFLDVPFGDYVIREIKQPDGYVLNDKLYPVSISQQDQVVEVQIENRIITGSVSLTKADSLKNSLLLSGFEFEVYVDVDRNSEFNPSIDRLLGTLEETEQGVYSLDGLRYGGYFLHESAQPGKEYVLDEDFYYFEIREDGETVVVSNADNGLFLNTPILGSLEIMKSSSDTRALLAGVGFRVRNAQGEIVGEGFTDENGVIRFDNLRYGKYTYQEFSTIDGYELNDTEYPFEITENGQVIKINMTNEPTPVDIPQTGDSVFAWATFGIATTAFSAAWVVLARKRKTK